ncbi:hypothetical protein [Deinococcus maricopensis]|uniref:Uncharacterized protein n=1 Tax=Deinococcus maricopensis (strain DSM 21211 / LMG 22137 / NRRL B-23946 / LB-34) TaxID=709986 RepID=E8U359_DEIML|nr:hypothetical protein [Deinococcus maricopensis]ADV66004.1 hypothetical protein Deima_0343 [Deinococcus maricopensis DSM 21211]
MTIPSAEHPAPAVSLVTLTGTSSDALYRVAQHMCVLAPHTHLDLYVVRSAPLNAIGVNADRVWRCGAVLALTSDLPQLRHIEHLQRQPLVADPDPFDDLLQATPAYHVERSEALTDLIAATFALARALDQRAPQSTDRLGGLLTRLRGTPRAAPRDPAALMSDLNRAAQAVQVREHAVRAAPATTETAEWDDVTADWDDVDPE